MPLKVRTILSLAVVLFAFRALNAQSTGEAASAGMFTDQGILSGSGLMILPTATVAPPSEMQVQYSRLIVLRNGAARINVFGLTSGFSQSLEGYGRLTSEELQTVSSQISYAFGLKFRFPGLLPVVRRLALWGESTFSDMREQNHPSLFPGQATRGAFLASLDSNKFHPTFLLGVSWIDNSTSLLTGGGITLALGHRAQLGLELTHGYLNPNSTESVLTGSFKLLSNTSFHVSPGYISTSGVSGWMISAGISLSTSDVDYQQVSESDGNKDKFILPSIDELEKQLKKEKQ
jgi:hypothetical protein